MPNIYDGEGKEFIQRLLKVSGGVTLNAFQDKILGPAMGWYASRCNILSIMFRASNLASIKVPQLPCILVH